MVHGRALALALIVTLVLAGCLRDDDPGEGDTDGEGPDGDGSRGDGATGPDDGSGVRLVETASGFTQPVLVLAPPGDTQRLWVLERSGTIHRVDAAGTTLWADLTDHVGADGNEQGLLGLAFHPDFADNGVAIVSYTDSAGDSVLSRFQGTPQGLDTDSEEVLLQVDQPYANHNGGHLAYGPDGMLLYGLGDGGLAGDPNLNGQNPATLLGAILRLDVGPEGPYQVPPDNPFVGDPAGADEVWVYGLRNPWRFSFDGEGGLWIGDVGQDAYEEVTHLPVGQQAGANLGWNLFEGDHQYPTGLELPVMPEGFVSPTVEYEQGPHCSVTGGHVYDGPDAPGLVGAYVYGDFCSGTLWRLDDPGQEPSVLREEGFPISSFGVGGDGALYVVDYAGGAVHRFAA